MRNVIFGGTALAAAMVASPALANEDAGSFAPLTQSTEKGTYWALDGGPDDASPSYTRIENLCLTTDGRRFFGIHPAAGNEPTFAITEGGPLPITLNPVDASAGKRHYKISNPEREDEYLTMNFIAPGTREAGLPSATAGLTSITTGEEYQVDCVENDQIVMIAATEDGAMIVTLEDDGLVLSSPEKAEGNTLDMRGGLYSYDAAGGVFHFFQNEGRISIGLSAFGQTDEEAILFESALAKENQQPIVYFLANPSLLAERVPTMAAETGSMIDRLSTCNHFAGETSEDTERNAQIMVQWKALECDAVPAQYNSALAAAADGSPLKTYLQANSPNWI